MDLPAHVVEILEGQNSISDRIRALGRAGYLRTEIRDFLGTSYQHVRNVLVAAGIEGGKQRLTGGSSAGKKSDAKAKPVPEALLLDGGFVRAASWELGGAHGIRLNAALPESAGVYAFVVDGTVKYVGKASKDLRRRFYYYMRPDKRQSTNIKMKERIRKLLDVGTGVDVLIAQPENHEWKGLPISRVAGLEEGLIYRFKPPWNIMK